MVYSAYIKKPSPIHSLWRKNSLYKANLAGTLFTFNKKAQRYFANVNPANLSILLRNPHVHVEVTTETVGEITTPSEQTTISEAPSEDTSESPNTD